MEIIYVLVNEAMPGLIKIGRTTEGLEARMGRLNRSTGVPMPFRCYFAAEVEDSCQLERQLHLLFSDFRPNPSREFFRVDPEKVIVAISIGPFKEINLTEDVDGIESDTDQEEIDVTDASSQRRPPLRLENLGIDVGSQLTFSLDYEITATVVEDNRVEYEGEVMSLSSSALKALHQSGRTHRRDASGPGYWRYKGELLEDIRNRMESAPDNNPVKAEDTTQVGYVTDTPKTRLLEILGFKNRTPN